MTQTVSALRHSHHFIFSFIMAERRQSDILYFVYLMLQLYQQVGSLVRFQPSISSFPTSRP